MSYEVAFLNVNQESFFSLKWLTFKYDAVYSSKCQTLIEFLSERLQKLFIEIISFVLIS